MKKLLFLILVFAAFKSEAQTVNGDRVIIRNALYLKDWWIKTIQRDSSLLSDTALPTSKAVRDFVLGRISGISGGSGGGGGYRDSLYRVNDTIIAHQNTYGIITYDTFRIIKDFVTNDMLAGGIDLTSKVTGLLPGSNIARANNWDSGYVSFSTINQYVIFHRLNGLPDTLHTYFVVTTTGPCGPATLNATKDTLNIPFCGGGSVSAPYNGTRLVTGSVTYVSGLTFYSTDLTYYILDTLYSSDTATITLDAADGTYGRYDGIYVDTAGTIHKYTGTASANPELPLLDQNYQFLLLTISVPAGATTPGGISDTTVYKENVEWVGSSAIAGADFAYTVNPYVGTYSTRIPSFTNLQKFQYKSLNTHYLGQPSFLKFFLRLGATFTASTQLNVALYNDTTQITTNVKISNGSYNFVRTTVGSYMFIVVPMGNFYPLAAATGFNKIVFNMSGANASGFQMDNVSLQYGGGLPTTSGILTVNGSANPHAIVPVVTSYGKNGGGDSTVLQLSDGSRYAAVDNSGSGGVSDFSAGDLSPLFTTSVATSTTTPALTFSLSNAAAYTNYGNNTSSSGAPTYFTNVFSDSLKVSGDSMYRKVNGNWYYQFSLRNNDTAYIRITASGLGTTQVANKGFHGRNITPAASGLQQISPAIQLEGQGWKTTATAASQPVVGIMDMLPYQASAAPTGLMRWGFNINNTGTVQSMTLSSGANSTLQIGPTGTYGLTLSAANGVISSFNVITLASYSGGNAGAFPSITYAGYNNSRASGSQNNYVHQFTGGFTPANSNVVDVFMGVEPVINLTGTKTGAYTALRINATETSVPSGQNRLFSVGTGGASYVETVAITPAGQLMVGTGTPEGSAASQVNSTTQGLLLPRMTKTQRDAITSPVAGLAVYQTDNTPGLRVYNGTNWMRFTETAD